MKVLQCLVISFDIKIRELVDFFIHFLYGMSNSITIFIKIHPYIHYEYYIYYIMYIHSPNIRLESGIHVTSWKGSPSSLGIIRYFKIKPNKYLCRHILLEFRILRYSHFKTKVSARNSSYKKGITQSTATTLLFILYPVDLYF